MFLVNSFCNILTLSENASKNYWLMFCNLVFPLNNFSSQISFTLWYRDTLWNIFFLESIWQTRIRMFLWKVFLVLTIIIKYAWVCLNKQDSEYASGPKYVKILNMAKFWIWQRSQFSSVTQGSEYARIYLDRVLITVLYPAVLGGRLIHTLKFTKAPPWLVLKEKKIKICTSRCYKNAFPSPVYS